MPVFVYIYSCCPPASLCDKSRESNNSPRELLRLAPVFGRTRRSHHTPMADLSRAWELIGVCLYDGMCLVVDVAVLRRMLCHGALVRRPFSLLTSELFAGVRAVQHA